MSTTSNWIHEFYQNLRVFEDYSFPKTCAMCGESYESLEDFVARTNRVNHPSGLSELPFTDDIPLVALFRNCPCGSTLMQGFEDRRDTSPRGRRRREQFGKLLDLLETQGLEREVARQEMLRMLRGQASRVLDGMGIHTPTEMKGDTDGTDGSQS